MSLIEKLTPEQEALIPVYGEKWQKIVFSVKPIEHQKAAEAVKAAYIAIGKKDPEIVFFASPYAADQKWRELSRQLPEQLSSDVSRELEDVFWNKLVGQTRYEMENQLDAEIEARVWEEMYNSMSRGVTELEHYLCIFGWCINLEDDWAIYAGYGDFLMSVLNLDCSAQFELSTLQSIVKYCGIIYPYEGLAMVCDRPRILSFDNQQHLHAEGAPAIQFADGFSVYAYHGTRLPEKYGKIHPNQWQAEWLLSEKNAELRRVLIQGIGYARICQELQSIELDTWQEYTLLKIDSDVDVEPIYLLKMICPSTGHIHVLRVPPHAESAREAIGWVNWGIDPEEFSVQT